MGNIPLLRSRTCTAPTFSDEVETACVNTGVEGTTVSSLPAGSSTPSHTSLERLEDTPDSRVSAVQGEPANINNDDSIISSLRQTIFSPELEAEFNDFFITSPSISPKTSPLPYIQRPQSPGALFPAQKYALPTLTDDSATHCSVDDVSDDTNSARDVSLYPNYPDEWREWDIENALAKLVVRFSPSLLIPKPNPFPGINLNFGWNRAHYAVLDRLICDVDVANLASPEEKKRLFECFKGYSFWAQMKPIELDEEQFGGMFERLFMGTGSVGRKPGSWWATKKDVFKEWRGKPVLRQIMTNFLKIGESVAQWKKSNLGAETNNLKRKSQGAPEVEGDDPVARKIKIARNISVKVMSDEWRVRRRLQEKKAGRWTDGTLRMDRMWDEYYWVLNCDNPRDALWDKGEGLLEGQKSSFSYPGWQHILTDLL
jgi:hypothetical protein